MGRGRRGGTGLGSRGEELVLEGGGGGGWGEELDGAGDEDGVGGFVGEGGQADGAVGLEFGYVVAVFAVLVYYSVGQDAGHFFRWEVLGMSD